MIKIIKNGNEKVYFARCPKCGTDFEYMNEDVVREEAPDTADSFVASLYPICTVICPVCLERIPATRTQRNDENAWANAMLATYGCIGGFGGRSVPEKKESVDG